MAQKKKNAQVATVKTKLLCMDASVLTNEKKFTPGDNINAQVEYVDEDNLRITEHPKRRRVPKTECPERKYHDLVGSLHGKICKTDFGVTMHVYVRHGEYKNSRALADIFENEAEQMCDLLSDIPLTEDDL